MTDTVTGFQSHLKVGQRNCTGSAFALWWQTCVLQGNSVIYWVQVASEPSPDSIGRLCLSVTMPLVLDDHFKLVLESMPALLYAYWTLAAGAAMFALLPVDVAPNFRCCKSWASQYVLLRRCRAAISQVGSCSAEAQCSFQQQEANSATADLERDSAGSLISWSHSNGLYTFTSLEHSATAAYYTVS